MMKVLSMTWSIYDERLSEFCQNCTGEGIVVKNLCEYIGKKMESWLFLGRFKFPEMQLGNIHIVGTDQVPKIQNEILDEEEKHLQEMAIAFSMTLEQLQPDIVNFHGPGALMQRCMKICIEKKVPFVYTEHLFIEMQPKFGNYNRSIEWEKQIYSISNLQVIAVSSGMKKKILEEFKHIDDESVYVIPNGTDFKAVIKDSDLKARYDLTGKKVLLCVGTLLERKNQSQIVRAFQKIPMELRSQIKVFFCGKDRMEGRLQREIEEAGLQDSLIYVGAVSSEDMKKYYSVAEGLIMPSYAEGLSIAALETIAYGLPVIMFSDSECAEDLSDEKVICFAHERSDECLAEAIIEWSTREWDRKYIVEYSKYYTMERMAEDYIKYYEKRLEKKYGKKRH